MLGDCIIIHDVPCEKQLVEDMCQAPDTPATSVLKSKNLWNPRARGKKAGLAQAGGQERNLQVFIFTSHPAL